MTLPLLALTALNTLLLTELLTNEGETELPSNNSVGNPLQTPYTPPFTGGQCEKVYTITYRYRAISNSSPARNRDITESVLGIGPVRGIATNIVFRPNDSTIYQVIVDARSIASPNERPIIGGFATANSYDSFTAEIISIIANDGIDNCGDLPGSSPTIGDNNNGLYQNEDEYSPELIKEGLAPLPIAALLTAAAAALEAAETIGELADAIAGIAEALKNAEDNEKSKERGEHFRLFRLNIGNVSRDGQIQINRFQNGNGTEKPLTLEVEFTSIPQGFGRYFGDNSPNRFIYQRLGYIAFISPNLGVIEVHECEFPRHSFNIPENCIGFYFHFGLNGNVKANLSCIIQQGIEQQ